jgi:hypothetical protein
MSTLNKMTLNFIDKIEEAKSEFYGEYIYDNNIDISYDDFIEEDIELGFSLIKSIDFDLDIDDKTGEYIFTYIYFSEFEEAGKQNRRDVLLKLLNLDIKFIKEFISDFIINYRVSPWLIEVNDKYYANIEE